MGILREVYYSMKRNIRSRGYMFWMMIFPILLSIFYYVSFGKFLIKDIDTINVGIYEDSFLADIFSEIDILNIVEIRGIEDLESENIDLIVDDELGIYTKGRNIETTIVKSIVDQVKQMKELNLPYEDYDFSIKYTKTHDEEVNGMMIVFFSLLGMVSSYASFGSSESTYAAKGDLSRMGARREMSSHSRSVFLLGGFIESLITNILSNIVIVLFLIYVLKIDIIRDIGSTVLLMLVGNIFGAAFGMFIGSLNMKDNNNKENIIRALMLIASTMAGMAGPDIKGGLDRLLPIVNKLNPVALVTDNLYRVNMLDNASQLMPSILQLLVYSVIFLGLAYSLLRRNRYDRI